MFDIYDNYMITMYEFTRECFRALPLQVINNKMFKFIDIKFTFFYFFSITKIEKIIEIEINILNKLN